MVKLSPTRTIIRGDSDKFRLSFTKKIVKSNGKHKSCSCLTGLYNTAKEDIVPIDITGWNIRFTVRPNVPDTDIVSDDDALISEEAIIVDAEKGEAMIYVKSENTTALLPGTYYYDIQVIKPLDEYGFHQVSSIRKGKYVVLGDITRKEHIYSSEDFEIIYGADGTVTLLNVSGGYTSDGKIIMSNSRVLSDTNGNVVLEYVPGLYSNTLSNDGYEDENEEADDADDGYTI